MALGPSKPQPADTLRELLLNILLSADIDAIHAATLATQRECWPEIFHESEVWSVAPQLAERITALRLSPPPQQLQDFKKVVIAAYARSASRAAKGAKALRHLNLLGIRAAAFKGLASMARLYPRHADRSIKDIDIVITQQDLGPAITALAELGFTPVSGQELETLDGLIEFLPGFSGNKAIVLWDADSLELDIHWDVSIPLLPMQTLLDQSEALTLYGIAVPVVALTHALALTTRHSIRENLAVDTMCRDLFDVRQACRHIAAADISQSLDEYCRLGGLLPLLALTGILHRLDSTELPTAAVFQALSDKATKNERQAGLTLVDAFFYQVRHGKLEKDLVYLSHTRPLLQILSGALRNWRQYRGLMLSIEDKVDGKTVSLGARFVRLASAATQAGPRRLRALRTIARLRFDAHNTRRRTLS